MLICSGPKHIGNLKSAEEKLVAFLIRCAEGVPYRKIGSDLGFASSTVQQTLDDVASAIVRRLGHLISLPTPEEVLADIRSFDDAYGVPFCAGAIDGSHIPIVVPASEKPAYINYKNFSSLVLHVVVNNRCQ
jgi:hypothetical protein